VAQTQFESDLYVNGNISARTITLPNTTVTNAMVAAAADIAATKLEHQRAISMHQVPGSAVVAETRDIHIVRGATGGLLQLEAAITGTIATGADRTVTIDLHKSTAAGAFATVLSGTVVLDNTSVLRTPEAATFSSTSLVDGDILRLVVTVAGAAGNQALGLVVTLTFTEKAS
jgi:hypothetical protein